MGRTAPHRFKNDAPLYTLYQITHTSHCFIQEVSFIHYYCQAMLRSNNVGVSAVAYVSGSQRYTYSHAGSTSIRDPWWPASMMFHCIFSLLSSLISTTQGRKYRKRKSSRPKRKRLVRKLTTGIQKLKLTHILRKKSLEKEKDQRS